MCESDSDLPKDDVEALKALKDEQFNRNCECFYYVSMLDALQHAHDALISEYYNERVDSSDHEHFARAIRSIRVIEDLLIMEPGLRFYPQ